MAGEDLGGLGGGWRPQLELGEGHAFRPSRSHGGELHKTRLSRWKSLGLGPDC